MEEILIRLYLVAYPIYFAANVITLLRDPRIRVLNQQTRFEYIKEVGSILFGYKTLFWFYFLTLFFQPAGH